MYFCFISFLIEIPACKQFRPRSDTALCSVWSWSALFANIPFRVWKANELSFSQSSHSINPLCPASHKWDLGKQCKSRSDAADQSLHCLHTEILIENKIQWKVHNKWQMHLSNLQERKISLGFKGLSPFEPRHMKPVFGVFNQGRLKMACSAAETS